MELPGIPPAATGPITVGFGTAAKAVVEMRRKTSAPSAALPMVHLLEVARIVALIYIAGIKSAPSENVKMRSRPVITGYGRTGLARDTRALRILRQDRSVGRKRSLVDI